MRLLLDILSALLSASLSTFVAMSTFEFIPPFDEIEVDKIEVVEKGTNTVIQYGTDCLDENRAFLSNKIDPLTDRIESLIDNNFSILYMLSPSLSCWGFFL